MISRGVDRSRVNNALNRGLNFLLTARSEPERSYWRDFNAYNNQSDEWVTAYVASALADTGLHDAREAASFAWNWLATHSHGPGLGYSRLSPQDADSTAWGIRLAASIGALNDRFAQECLTHLSSYVRASGGFGTFSAEDVIRAGFGNNEDAVSGWTRSHVCVTAPAARVLEMGALCDAYRFLQRRQEPTGCWRAYWWADDEYSTAYAIDSLAQTAEYGDQIRRGAQWLLVTSKNPSPFALALRVLGISRSGLDFRYGIQQLLLSQLEDGSWPASARLRIPPPSLEEPKMLWNWNEMGNGVGSIQVDQHRVFTTATVVRALSACLK